MPELNIPLSYNKTKSTVKNIGLHYEKIDACPNDCMLFRNDHKDDEFCHTCGASRYIKNPEVDHDVQPSKKSHQVSAKTLRHFPLIPRLKVQTRFNRRARNNDECDPSDAETESLFPQKRCPLGARKTDPFILDKKSLSQAHAYLLGNCDEIQEYIREHEQEVNNHPRRSKWSKAKDHCQNFSQWFETCALQEDVPDLIKKLSRGPNFVTKRYSRYLINGYRFHIRQRDARRKTQNSGVTVVASTTSFASSKDKNSIAANLTYYGRIVEYLWSYLCLF
ncbi:hypothetical protein RDI58_024546 [Solanum bulbocastanum]|uniref:Uncharacterized protein n=1 Tax=Solanum bulbocastanum TaxID=147425 RepID=A0AAN8SXV6_SOLBU